MNLSLHLPVIFAAVAVCLSLLAFSAERPARIRVTRDEDRGADRRS